MESKRPPLYVYMRVDIYVVSFSARVRTRMDRACCGILMMTRHWQRSIFMSFASSWTLCILAVHNVQVYSQSLSSSHNASRIDGFGCTVAVCDVRFPCTMRVTSKKAAIKCVCRLEQV